MSRWVAEDRPPDDAGSLWADRVLAQRVSVRVTALCAAALSPHAAPLGVVRCGAPEMQAAYRRGGRRVVVAYPHHLSCPHPL